MSNECGACGKKITFITPRVKVADGVVCNNCYESAVGKNLLDAHKYSVSDIAEILYPKPLVFIGNTASEKLSNLVIEYPGITLKEGEVCFYENTNVSAYHEKKVVTGTKSKGSGASVRVAKGVTVHAGGGGSEKIRETVAEIFPGRFYLTNMRVVLLSSKYGFDASIKKINSVEPYKDAIIFYVGSKCYTMLTRDVDNIISVIQLNNEAFHENNEKQVMLPEKTSTVKKSKSLKSQDEDIAETLRKLKGLVDDGILTQEEFETKKKQLLDI